MDWYVLEFSGDDVVMAWQDARLAEQCAALPEAASLEIVQAPAAGDGLVCWYVSEPTARVLDAHGVGWRRFCVRRCEAPPAGATPVLGAARS
ncbi:MAG: hypothetical protein D6689_20010 [Deltaproteobacteria bacterium]|nr:MAG: hypothetical protein D6689_20010 [Deltaproteobacteria bacterium]